MDLPNELAWKNQIQGHQGWLRTILRARVDNVHDADDLLQEVFADALEADADQVRDTAPWLYRIAIRKVLLHRRRCGRNRKALRTLADAAHGEEPSVIHEPLRTLLGQEHAAQIQRAFARLDGSDREILLLKYEHNWNYEQIGCRLGITRDKVTHRLRRARKRLRQSLNATGQ